MPAAVAALKATEATSFASGTSSVTDGGAFALLRRLSSELADSVVHHAASTRGASPALDSTAPGVFSLAKEEGALDAVPLDGASHSTFQSVPDQDEEISAAGYDPSADRRAEDIRRLQNESVREEVKDLKHATVEGGQLVEPAADAKEEDLGDDDDDDDDMFSGVVKVKKARTSAVPVSSLSSDRRRSSLGALTALPPLADRRSRRAHHPCVGCDSF